jgi:molecular chaperone GrpE
LNSKAEKQDLHPDPGEAEEIEILEVLGLEEDSPAAGVRRRSPRSHDPDEVTLEFDEGDEARDEDLDRAVQPDDGEQEQLLRLQADFENFKKRTEREQESAQRQAAAGLIKRLLPVLDNFERALSSEVPEGDGRAFQHGVALIFRQLLEELRHEGLTAVDSLAQPFDPNVHEAVATERVPGLPGNTVVEELRRGYLLHDRLLRPAQVRVCVEEDDPASETERSGEDS